MNEHDVLLSHPHDHFHLLHLSVIPNTCFVLMPFDERFDIVYETIAKALKGLMVCSRADDLPIGKPILERVLTGIRSSEMIVADLTDRNANVFYELGLAHTHTKNVLLLTQDLCHVPFDLRGLYCHKYSPNSKSGLKRLAEAVRAAAHDVRSRAVPTMLQGSLTRTQQIVEYMERQLTRPLTPKGMLIRAQAGFSSVSNVGYPAAEDPDVRNYGESLERERDLLVRMLSAGAILRAIIFPPVGPWTKEYGTRWWRRYEMLLEFLNGSLWDRCEFVLSTEEGPNLLFFGDEVLFEGHKTGIESGYGWTMVYTDPAYLKTRLTIFDMLFQSAKRHTMTTYGPAGAADGDHEALRAATVKAVEMARDGKAPRWQAAGIRSSTTAAG